MFSLIHRTIGTAFPALSVLAMAVASALAWPPTHAEYHGPPPCGARSQVAIWATGEVPTMGWNTASDAVFDGLNDLGLRADVNETRAASSSVARAFTCDAPQPMFAFGRSGSREMLVEFASGDTLQLVLHEGCDDDVALVTICGSDRDLVDSAGLAVARRVSPLPVVVDHDR